MTAYIILFTIAGLSATIITLGQLNIWFDKTDT
jgi:hypothetical protein